MADFKALIEGYRRFRETNWERERERWSTLASGQSPRVMVIACSDSRVDPSQIFDARPGEMFVVRNVANLVPPCEADIGGRHGVSAALEFAVTQIEVEEIVVMGHEMCGGCAAALTGQFDEAGQGQGHFIADWIATLGDARERVRLRCGDDLSPEAFRAMEYESVRTSLDNLRSFPWVREREEQGRLTLHGAYFSIAEGVLHVLDEGAGTFTPA
jgi:carbonic anhydrase